MWSIELRRILDPNRAAEAQTCGASPFSPRHSLQTETGTMVVSTPEATALDVVRFPRAAGQWNNIATVLVELAENMDPERLIRAAELGRLSDAFQLLLIL